jgi:hypothetical protein
MASTFTTNKNLEEPGTGDTNWNTPLNNNFTAIDKAFGSFVSIATITGNYALVTADLQNMCFKSNTSAFTGNVTYTIPAGIKGQWVVINQSAASAFTLSIVCGASSVVVDNGKTRSIYCDGTSVFYADSPTTAGSNGQVIFNYAGTLIGSSNLVFNGVDISAGGSTATTGASCSGTTATVTFSNGQTIPTNSLVTITGVTPTGYNGTWVTAGTATLNQVQFTVPSTLTSQTVAGTLSYGNIILGGNIIGAPASQALAVAGTNNYAIMTPLSTAQAITGQVGVANAASVKTAVNASGSAPIYACRAWVNFDGTTTTPTIRASGNVSSVTRLSTGYYRINFTTAMQDANYSAVGTGGNDGVGTASSHQKVFLIDRSTTSVALVSQNDDGSGAQDSQQLSVAIFR